MGKRKNKSKNNRSSGAAQASSNPFEILDSDVNISQENPSEQNVSHQEVLSATTTTTTSSSSSSSKKTTKANKAKVVEPEVTPRYDPEALVAALKPRSTLAALGIELKEPSEYASAFVNDDETIRLAALQLMAALLHGAADGVTDLEGLESLLIVRIMNTPGALDAIVFSLSDKNSPEIQISGSDTLLGLSRFVDHTISLARAAASSSAGNSSDEEGASPSRRRRRHRRTQSNPTLEAMLSKLLSVMTEMVDVVNNVSIPKQVMSNIARTLALLSHHDGDLRAQLESRGAFSSLMAAWDSAEDADDQTALFMAMAELRKHTVPQRLAVAGTDNADITSRARSTSLGDGVSPKRIRPHIVFRWSAAEDDGPVSSAKVAYRGNWTAGVAQNNQGLSGAPSA